MPATKRHKHLKKFKFNCNRKRLGRVRRKAQIVPPTMPVIKKVWEEKKSARENVSSMGLCFDVNSSLKIPSTKEFFVSELQQRMKETQNNNLHANNRDTEKLNVKDECVNSDVVTALEEEANTPREKRLALPKGQIMWLSFLIDKYGDDYKAMSRDSRNLNQETWKQLRAKIKTFRSLYL